MKVTQSNNRDEMRDAIDMVVTTRMYDMGGSMLPVSIGQVISACQKAAIDATYQKRYKLADIFVHLGAELIATFNDGLTGCAITRPSGAVRLVQNLDACADAMNNPQIISAVESVAKEEFARIFTPETIEAMIQGARKPVH